MDSMQLFIDCNITHSISTFPHSKINIISLKSGFHKGILLSAHTKSFMSVEVSQRSFIFSVSRRETASGASAAASSVMAAT